jgi:hypothetical protein
MLPGVLCVLGLQRAMAQPRNLPAGIVHPADSEIDRTAAPARPLPVSSKLQMRGGGRLKPKRRVAGERSCHHTKRVHALAQLPSRKRLAIHSIDKSGLGGGDSRIDESGLGGGDSRLIGSIPWTWYFIWVDLRLLRPASPAVASSIATTCTLWRCMIRRDMLSADIAAEKNGD